MKLNDVFHRIKLGHSEVHQFTTTAEVVSGITDEKGVVHLVQAPALQFLPPDEPKVVRFRWLFRDVEGRLKPAYPIQHRRVVRRDTGSIPQYYFIQ